MPLPFCAPVASASETGPVYRHICCCFFLFFSPADLLACRYRSFELLYRPLIEAASIQASSLDFLLAKVLTFATVLDTCCIGPSETGPVLAEMLTFRYNWLKCLLSATILYVCCIGPRDRASCRELFSFSFFLSAG